MRTPAIVVVSVLTLFAPVVALGQAGDMGVIRKLLDSDYAGVSAILVELNARLAASNAGASPEADPPGDRWTLPEALPEINMLALGESNYGAGLVTTLLDGAVDVKQVNLLFCAGRVGAVQVLFDDSETFGDTVQLLTRLHGMGPSVPFGSHQPAFRYPLPGVHYDEMGRWSLLDGGSPVTVWDMGTREALYHPVAGRGSVSGQFWMTSRELARECAGAASQ